MGEAADVIIHRPAMDDENDENEDSYPKIRQRTNTDQDRLVRKVANDLCNTYRDISSVAEKVETYVEDNEERKKELTSMKTKCSSTISMLKDTERKRIFIGSTSQGKSTFVNAFLQRRILPTGLGSTTSQIVKVRGHGKRSYCVRKTMKLKGHESKEVPITREFKDATSMIDYVWDINKKEKDTVNALELLLPLAVFPMLQGNVVLIDSPGMGHTDLFNQAVDAHSKAVRTVVLICNLETDLTQMDMANMKRLCSGATPGVCFIVMNKWDRALQELPKEREREELRGQQTERCVKFLINELNVNEEEAADKVFFLSGLAVLNGEPEAVENFEDFFRILKLKEEEALGMKNISEHKKSVQIMMDDLKNITKDILDQLEEDCTQKTEKVISSELVKKAKDNCKQTVELKLTSTLHDVQGEYEDKISDAEDITEARATQLLQEYLDETETSIDEVIQDQIESSVAEMKGILKTEAPDDITRMLTTRLNESPMPRYRSHLKKNNARYYEALGWNNFQVTHRVESDMKTMRKTIGHLQASFRSKVKADEAMKQMKEAKAAYAVATQKVLLEVTEDMKKQMKRKRNGVLGICMCGGGNVAKMEQKEAAIELSERASKRIIERSQKIQEGLREERNANSEPEPDGGFLEFAESMKEQHLVETVRQEYRDRITKVKKIFPEIKRNLLEAAEPLVDKTLDGLVELTTKLIQEKYKEQSAVLEKLQESTEDISEKMGRIEAEAHALF